MNDIFEGFCPLFLLYWHELKIMREINSNPINWKDSIRELWKQTFHDTDKYLDLIFNHCFYPNLCAVWIEDNELLASLVGIPYELSGRLISQSYDFRKELLEGNKRVVYICGLTTRHDVRGRGIMSKLLDEIAYRYRNMGYQGIILIPADKKLRDFYKKRGFMNLFARRRFILSECADNNSLSNVYCNYETVICKITGRTSDLELYMTEYRYCRENKRFIELKKINLSEERIDLYAKNIYKMLSFYENNLPFPSLFHTFCDVRIIIKENIISGGDIFFIYNDKKSYDSLIFVSKTENTIVIPMCIGKSAESIIKLFYSVKNIYGENKKIEFLCSPYDYMFRDIIYKLSNEKKLTYTLEPYVMMRLLTPSNNIIMGDNLFCRKVNPSMNYKRDELDDYDVKAIEKYMSEYLPDLRIMQVLGSASLLLD